MNNNLKKNTKDELIDEIIKLREKNKDLENENKDLKWKLNTNMTNSGNSSSTERFTKKKKITNLRTASNKTKWGQLWHKWSNLNRNENVDEVVNLAPEKCWNNLLNGLSKIARSVTRQIIDLEKLKTKVTDYIITDIIYYNWY